ncbi:MAG: peptide-methionine (S)-S-oxide reductase MsrA [Pseudomonadota bacterium]
MFLIDMLTKKTKLPTEETALAGRSEPVATAETHFVNGNQLAAPFPDGLEQVQFGLGCFWGAERIFWKLDGVYVTAVGYGAGMTPNPTYNEVCSGGTGHNELVLVVYDPSIISFEALVKTFFESHDPTQGMRQGNDVGTQYRSGIYVTSDEQHQVAERMAQEYGEALADNGVSSAITTEIEKAGPFYYAEEYHQQYLAKNPNGYCGLGGTGVSCPISAPANA